MLRVAVFVFHYVCEKEACCFPYNV